MGQPGGGQGFGHVGDSGGTGVPVGGGPQPLRVSAGAVSHVGNYRRANEDSYCADMVRGVFLVADGMGGHQGGRQASELVCRTVAEKLTEFLAGPDATVGESLELAMADAILAARRRLQAFVAEQPVFQGMGSTLVLAVLSGSVVHLANVGDSRAYWLHEGDLRLMTIDDTLVQFCVDMGTLTPEQARCHPLRSVLLDSVSADEVTRTPRIVQWQVSPGDRLVLVSDGVTDVLDAGMIREIVGGTRDPQQAAENLVKAALDSDSKDNVTGLIVSFQ